MNVIHFITRFVGVVWDALVDLSALPGGWIFPVALSALVLLGVYMFVELLIDAVRDIWREKREARARTVNLALYKAQRENEDWIKSRRKHLTVVSQTGGRHVH